MRKFLFNHFGQGKILLACVIQGLLVLAIYIFFHIGCIYAPVLTPYLPWVRKALVLLYGLSCAFRIVFGAKRMPFLDSLKLHLLRPYDAVIFVGYMSKGDSIFSSHPGLIVRPRAKGEIQTGQYPYTGSASVCVRYYGEIFDVPVANILQIAIPVGV